MFSFFRRLSKSKIGTVIMAIVLLAILAGFALATSPISAPAASASAWAARRSPKSATKKSPTAR